jgi:hypothetical protein
MPFSLTLAACITSATLTVLYRRLRPALRLILRLCLWVEHPYWRVHPGLRLGLMHVH